MKRAVVTLSCPACSASITIAREPDFAEIDCAACGKRLWFVRRADSADHVDLFDFDESASLRSELVSRMALVLGVAKSVVVDAARAGQLLPGILEEDSLDLMEILLSRDSQDD